MVKAALFLLGLAVMGNYLYHLMGLDWTPSLGRWKRKVTGLVVRVFRQIAPSGNRRRRNNGMTEIDAAEFLDLRGYPSSAERRTLRPEQ